MSNLQDGQPLDGQPLNEELLAELVTLHEQCGVEGKLRLFLSSRELASEDAINRLIEIRDQRKAGIKKILQGRGIKLTSDSDTDQQCELHHVYKVRVRLLMELYDIPYDETGDQEAQHLWRLTIAMAEDQYRSFEVLKKGGPRGKYVGPAGMKFYAEIRAEMKHETLRIRDVLGRQGAPDGAIQAATEHGKVLKKVIHRIVTRRAIKQCAADVNVDDVAALESLGMSDQDVDDEIALERGYYTAQKDINDQLKSANMKTLDESDEFEKKLLFYLKHAPRRFDAFDLETSYWDQCYYTGLSITPAH